MVKQRVVETDQGITGEFTCEAYDAMQRRFRDKGWMETKDIIKSGIISGLALEIGPGPGYLGLEWLKQTEGTTLKGLDISDDMIALANRNAAEYALTDRVEYVKGDSQKLPFEDAYFDAVFTNGSLHEWSNPQEVMNEMYRVLKPGGRYNISDLKRDIRFYIKWFLWFAAKPKVMRSGLISSINAAYTGKELEALKNGTALQEGCVTSNFIGLQLTGQ